jgi:beta-lactamase class A
MTSQAALLLLSSLIQASPIDSQLAKLEAGSKGKLGAAIITPVSSHYSRKGERFSLQSVMKLMVAMAALDEVDKGRWKLDQKLTFRRSDLSVSHQPLADLLGTKRSMTVTLDQCIDFMVTQSCSAAADFVIRRLGGTSAVNAFLKKHGVRGMSVDRQERDLQTAVAGVSWKPEYIDAEKLEAAIARLPNSRKDAAYRRYQSDPRDTTTPEAMGFLLQKLVTGKLFTKKSTAYLMGVMERTETGADRLKAGVPAGWTLGHKTGTSSTHRGLAWATNDVGYARKSSGEWVIIVALLRGSTLPPEKRARILRQVAEIALQSR